MARSGRKGPADRVLKYVDYPFKSGLFQGRQDYYEQLAAETFSDVVEVESVDDMWQRSDWKTEKKLLNSLGDWPLGYYSVVEGLDCPPNLSHCRLSNQCMILSRDIWDPPLLTYSGMFTGRMRQVAQLLFGMNRACPYRFCFERTHGIFTAANGDPWVIEISVEDGITAWPLAVRPLQDPSKYGMDLPYMPRPRSSLPPLAERVVLAAPNATLADHDYYYRNCGWAFDSDGHRATNTSSTASDDPGIDARKSYLWDVVITESNNAPVSATLEITDSDWLYTETDTTHTIKFPFQAGPCFRSTAQSVFVDYPPEGNLRAPVYAYYQEDDTKIIVYQRFQPLASTPIDERPSGTLYGCNILQYGIPQAGGSYVKGTTVTARATWYETVGIARSLETPNQVYMEKPAEVSGSWQQLGAHVARVFDNGTPGIASQHWRLTETLTTYVFNAPAWFETLLIPFFERTAFYISQGKSDTAASTKTVQTVSTGYGAGTFTPLLTCSAVLFDELTLYSGKINPCGCGEIGDTIGFVVESGVSSSSIDGYALLATGIPLKSPITEPNNPWGACDFDIYCFDDARAADFTERTACSWTDSKAVGSCMSRTETEVTDEIPASDGHFKVNFYFNGQVHILVDDIFDFFTYEPWWKYIEAPSSEGCQYLEVKLDAFTNVGWLSANINAPMNHSQRYFIGSPGTYFPIDEVSKQEAGWFGIPLPELG